MPVGPQLKASTDSATAVSTVLLDANSVLGHRAQIRELKHSFAFWVCIAAHRFRRSGSVSLSTMGSTKCATSALMLVLCFRGSSPRASARWKKHQDWIPGGQRWCWGSSSVLIICNIPPWTSSRIWMTSGALRLRLVAYVLVIFSMTGFVSFRFSSFLFDCWGRERWGQAELQNHPEDQDRKA